MKYIVEIKIGYSKALFKFDTAQEAGEFIALLAVNNVKGEDAVTFSMKAVQEVEE